MSMIVFAMGDVNYTSDDDQSRRPSSPLSPRGGGKDSRSDNTYLLLWYKFLREAYGDSLSPTEIAADVAIGGAAVKQTTTTSTMELQTISREGR